MLKSASRLVAFGLILCGLFHAASLHADDAVPKGEVAKYSFEQSKIFPGTVREYSVYVPKQYDPAKPACLYVNQDGVQFNAPAVFDELIHKQEMPPTINLQNPDLGCDLDYLARGARPYPVEVAMNINAGFGGRYACLILRRYTGS